MEHNQNEMPYMMTNGNYNNS